MIRRSLVKAAMLTLALIVVMPHASAADLIDLRGGASISGDPAAGQRKSETCAACHGADGFAPVPTFPNLAGQPAAYTYWQLVAFKQAARPESPMTPMVAALTDEDFRDLAAYYATLPVDVVPATPLPPADPVVLARGGMLFASGDPERGVPPCQGCHGADAGGLTEAQGAMASWPHLRGQQAMYLSQKLQKYHDGQDIDSTQDRIMQGVAHALQPQDIEALSTYLASLRPAAASP